MIADTGGSASVSADIETQMGHGWPATGRLLAVGIRPSLSIDVCVSNGGDMFHAMKTTISTQRALENAAAGWTGQQDRIQLTCRDVLDFATLQGARTLGLESKIGSLVPGKEADIVMIRRDGLSLTPLNNPYGAVVYSAHAGMVDTVLVAGKVVKRDGRLTALDVNRIRDLALETREHLLAAAACDAIIADAKLGGDWIPATATAE
jgi:5-methylthioadenosine/S-adenosylhomocysteine deaminase